jgi:segregation and condensation protein B
MIHMMNEEVASCLEMGESLSSFRFESEEVQLPPLPITLEEMDSDEQEERLWQARSGLNGDTLCGAIETIIFMSEKPIALTKIKNLIDEDLPLRAIHQAISRLQQEYERNHHGLRLMEIAEGYQFRTKVSFSRFVQDLYKVNSLVLTPSTMEVLALIAYRQPVARVEIDRIRGVESSHLVRTLVDKRLIKVVGRSDDLGRPTIYGTTLEFLEVFNLASIDDLPCESELEELAGDQAPSMEKIRELSSLEDAEQFDADNLEELDKLSADLKSIMSETNFTKSLKVEDKRRLDSEGEVIKSAFDLLEEHLDRKQVSEQNRIAITSDIGIACETPKVVKELGSDKFHNVPSLESEEDDFEMIDLDTGEHILGEDLLNTSSDMMEEDQESDLSAALDQAFDRLLSTPEEAEQAVSGDVDIETLAREFSCKTDSLELTE